MIKFNQLIEQFDILTEFKHDTAPVSLIITTCLVRGYIDLAWDIYAASKEVGA